MDAFTGAIMVWGIVMPRMLIQAWRAMRMLEHFIVIEENTISDLWGVAVDDSSFSRACMKRLYRQFTSQFPANFQKLPFAELRKYYLRACPEEEDLRRIVEVCVDHDIMISLDELRQEQEKGRMEFAWLQGLIDKADKYYQEIGVCEDAAEKLCATLAPEYSLAGFCGDIHLDGLVIRMESGKYEPISPAEFQKVVMRAGVCEEWVPLLQGKDGETPGHPAIQCSKGRNIYTLKRVKYCFNRGAFVVEYDAENTRSREVTNGLCSYLPMLRKALMGSPTPVQILLRKLTNLPNLPAPLRGDAQRR
jgi:hypothetical protein